MLLFVSNKVFFSTPPSNNNNNNIFSSMCVCLYSTSKQIENVDGNKVGPYRWKRTNWWNDGWSRRNRQQIKGIVDSLLVSVYITNNHRRIRTDVYIVLLLHCPKVCIEIEQDLIFPVILKNPARFHFINKRNTHLIVLIALLFYIFYTPNSL